MSRKSINSNIGGACLKCVIEERDHSMSRKSINSNIGGACLKCVIEKGPLYEQKKY